MLDPDRPDFTRCDWYRALPFHPLHQPDELVDRLFRAQRSFVAHHDCVDVAVTAGGGAGSPDFPLVAGLRFFDPEAERVLVASIRGKYLAPVAPARGGIGADGLTIN